MILLIDQRIIFKTNNSQMFRNMKVTYQKDQNRIFKSDLMLSKRLIIYKRIFKNIREKLKDKNLQKIVSKSLKCEI